MEEVELLKRSLADLALRLECLTAGQDQTMLLLEAAAASERQMLLRIDQLESFSAHAGAAGDQVSMVLSHLSADMAALQARLTGVEQAMRLYHTAPAPPPTVVAAAAAGRVPDDSCQQGSAVCVLPSDGDRCQPQQQEQRQQSQPPAAVQKEAGGGGGAHAPRPMSPAAAPQAALAADAADGDGGDHRAATHLQAAQVVMPTQASSEAIHTGSTPGRGWSTDVTEPAVTAGSSRSSSRSSSPMSATRRSLTAAFEASDAPTPAVRATGPTGSASAGGGEPADAGPVGLDGCEVLGELSKGSSTWCGFDHGSGAVGQKEAQGEVHEGIADGAAQQQQLAAGEEVGGAGSRPPKQHTPIRWRSNQLSDLAAHSSSPGGAAVHEDSAAAAAAPCVSSAGGAGTHVLHAGQQEEAAGRLDGSDAAAGCSQTLLAAQEQVAGSSCSLGLRQELGAGELLQRLLERVQQLEAQQQAQQQQQQQLQATLSTQKHVHSTAPAASATAQLLGEPMQSSAPASSCSNCMSTAPRHGPTAGPDPGSSSSSSSHTGLLQLMAAAVAAGALWGRQGMAQQQRVQGLGAGQPEEQQQGQAGDGMAGQSAVPQQVEVAWQARTQAAGQQQPHGGRQQAGVELLAVCSEPSGSSTGHKEAADTGHEVMELQLLMQHPCQVAQQQSHVESGEGRQIGQLEAGQAADRSQEAASEEAVAAGTVDVPTAEAAQAAVAVAATVREDVPVQEQTPVGEQESWAPHTGVTTLPATAAAAAAAAVVDGAVAAVHGLQQQQQQQPDVKGMGMTDSAGGWEPPQAAGGQGEIGGLAELQGSALSAVCNDQDAAAAEEEEQAEEEEEEAEEEEESDTLPELFRVPPPTMLRRVSAEVARPWERLPSERPHQQQVQGQGPNHSHHHHQQQQQQRRLSASPDRGRSRAKPGWRSTWGAPRSSTTAPLANSSSSSSGRQGDADTTPTEHYSSVRRSLQAVSSSGRSGSGGGWCFSTRVTPLAGDGPAAAAGSGGGQPLRVSQVFGGVGNSSSSSSVGGLAGGGGREGARLLRASYAGEGVVLDTAAAGDGRGQASSRHRYDQDAAAGSSSGMNSSKGKHAGGMAAAAAAGAAGRVPSKSDGSGKAAGAVSSEEGGAGTASKGSTVQQGGGKSSGRPGLRSHPLRSSMAVTCSDISLSQASSHSGISAGSRSGSKPGAAAADAASGGRALQDQSSKQHKGSGGSGARDRAHMGSGGKVVLLSRHPVHLQHQHQQHRYVVAATTSGGKGTASSSSSTRGPTKDHQTPAQGGTGGTSSGALSRGDAAAAPQLQAGRRHSTQQAAGAGLSSSVCLVELGSLGATHGVRHSVGGMGHLRLQCSPWAAAAMPLAAGGARSGAGSAVGAAGAAGSVDSTTASEAAAGSDATGTSNHTTACHAARVTPPITGGAAAAAAAGGQGAGAGSSAASKRAAWRRF